MLVQTIAQNADYGDQRYFVQLVYPVCTMYFPSCILRESKAINSEKDAMCKVRLFAMTDNILKIDIDMRAAPNVWELWVQTRSLMLESLGYKVIRTVKHNSRKGWHVWIHLNQDVTDYEKALLQFLCGEDYRRSRLNFYREQNGQFKDFNLLFNHKSHKEASIQAAILSTFPES